MAKSGFVLRSTSLTDVDQLGRRQPNCQWILVSEERKKIAIVDLCRPLRCATDPTVSCSHTEAADH
jgi:hypothetical protein